MKDELTVIPDDTEMRPASVDANSAQHLRSKKLLGGRTRDGPTSSARPTRDDCNVHSQILRTREHVGRQLNGASITKSANIQCGRSNGVES